MQCRMHRPQPLTGWYAEMKMLIGGTWQAAASGRTEDVTSPFDGTITGTVHGQAQADLRAALDRAEAGAVTWRRTRRRTSGSGEDHPADRAGPGPLPHRRRPAGRGALRAHRPRRRMGTASATLWSPTRGCARSRSPGRPPRASTSHGSPGSRSCPWSWAPRARSSCCPTPTSSWPPARSRPAATSTRARSAFPCSGSSPTRPSPRTSSTRWCLRWRRSRPVTRGPPTPAWAR